MSQGQKWDQSALVSNCLTGPAAFSRLRQLRSTKMSKTQPLTPIPDKPEFDIFYLAESITSLKADRQRHDALIHALSEQISALQSDLRVCQEDIQNKFECHETKIQAMELRSTEIEARTEQQQEHLRAFQQETAKAAAVAAEKLQQLKVEPVYDPSADIATLKRSFDQSEKERKSENSKQEAKISAQMKKIEEAHAHQENFESLIIDKVKVHPKPFMLLRIEAFQPFTM